jgi:hypothetical protein
VCQILPRPISRCRFKFQSNLIWDSIFAKKRYNLTIRLYPNPPRVFFKPSPVFLSRENQCWQNLTWCWCSVTSLPRAAATAVHAPCVAAAGEISPFLFRFNPKN